MTLLPNKDTGVIITKAQADALYTFQITHQQAVATIAVMQQVLDSCKAAIPVFADQIQAHKEIISLKDAAIATRDAALLDYGTVLHHREKQIIRLQWQKVLIATVGCLTTGFMTYAYISK